MKNLKSLLLSCVLMALVFACKDSSVVESEIKPQKKEMSETSNKEAESAAKELPSLVNFDAVSLAKQLQTGELTAVEVTTAFLNRIKAIDSSGPTLNSVIEVNPDALELAAALDKRFAASGPVGQLHGMPVLIKANIDTSDRMATSAGSLALQNHYASADAPVVVNLRAAGAIVIGKANLSEWANFRSTNSSSGWSSIGGLTKNPYVLDRNSCGSSSGSAVAVAAHLVPLAVGTETDGSVVCPSSVNGVVGIKPTIGRVSGKGIIPISVTQDTAGPMATTVAGAELLYQAMHGLEFEPPLKEVKLKGLRIGVWSNYFGSEGNPGVSEVFSGAISHFEKAGAVVIDQVRLEGTEPVNQAEYEVLLFEFKDGLNQYLQDGGLGFTLENLIEFNNDNAEDVMPHFAQEIFDAAQAKGDLNSPEYKQALQDSHFAMQTILKDVFAEHKLDVLIAPTNQPAWKTTLGDGDEFKLGSSAPAAVSGYPNITVPMGNVNGLPIGLSLIGLENDDEKLIEIAKQFEAIAKARIEPQFIQTLDE